LKEAKRSTLDDRHYYLFDIVSDRLGLDKNDVEDSVLNDSQLNLVDSFFEVNGNSYVTFCYSELDLNNPNVASLSKTNNKALLDKIKKNQLHVVECSKIPLEGIVIFFIRRSPSIAITSQNISNVSFILVDNSINSLILV
jgi:hypothetical protein